MQHPELFELDMRIRAMGRGRHHLRRALDAIGWARTYRQQGESGHVDALRCLGEARYHIAVYEREFVGNGQSKS